eukprot:CFRG3757T1
MRTIEKAGWFEDYKDQYLPNASLYERMLLVIDEAAKDNKDLSGIESPRIEWLNEKLRKKPKSVFKKYCFS